MFWVREEAHMEMFVVDDSRAEAGIPCLACDRKPSRWLRSIRAVTAIAFASALLSTQVVTAQERLDGNWWQELELPTRSLEKTMFVTGLLIGVGDVSWRVLDA